VLAEAEDPGNIFRDTLNGFVQEYFFRSMAGNWDGYPWQEVASRLAPEFRQKSVEHGFLGVDEYAEFMESIGTGPGVVSRQNVQDLAVQGAEAIPDRLELINSMFGYSITKQDIYNRIQQNYNLDMDDPYSWPSAYDVWWEAMSEHVEQLQRVFGDGIHKDIYEIYKDLARIDRLPLKQKVNLINRAIHAEHETGDVVERLADPDGLRQDAEKEFQRRRSSKVARVRNNPNFI
jgi:hypothetical protein